MKLMSKADFPGLAVKHLKAIFVHLKAFIDGKCHDVSVVISFTCLLKKNRRLMLKITRKWGQKLKFSLVEI